MRTAILIIVWVIVIICWVITAKLWRSINATNKRTAALNAETAEIYERIEANRIRMTQAKKEQKQYREWPYDE